MLGDSHIAPQPPVEVQAVVTDDGSAAEVKITWQPSGGSDYTSTSGETWPGITEQAGMASQYIVQMSYDGGESWWNVEGCESVTSAKECNAKELMAGTPYQFRVLTGGATGWSDASEPTAVFTEDTGASKECREKLQAQADGSYVAVGTIVAIVFGVVAGIALIAFGILDRKSVV